MNSIKNHHFITFILLFFIAIIGQSLINFLEIKEPANLYIVPFSITFFIILAWLLSKKETESQQIFRILAIIFSVLLLIWFVIVNVYQR